MSPTQRTLNLLRTSGYRAAVVEKWNAHAKLRQDLFGFADIIAVTRNPNRQPQRLLINATGITGVAGHVQKIRETAAARDCIAAGFSVEVWGWCSRTKRLRRVSVTAEAVRDAGERRRWGRKAEQAELFAS